MCCQKHGYVTNYILENIINKLKKNLEDNMKK